MNRQPVWHELIERLGAVADGTKVTVSHDELKTWPELEVRALRQAGLLVKTKPATSGLCPGCEQQCSMEVHTLTTPRGTVESFIVCDKRDDTARVSIPTESLEQWKCSINQVLNFVASALGIGTGNFNRLDSGLQQVGMAFGNTRSQVLCLQREGMRLVAGGKNVALAELIILTNGLLDLDHEKIRKLIDSSTTGDPHYTPSTIKREAGKLKTKELYASWQKAFKQLQKQKPDMSNTWYAKKIAKMPIAQGKSSDTIRKNMI